MHILSQLSIFLYAASLVSAGCSVCPATSGRCTAEDGSGCREVTVKFDWLFVRNYCCRDAEHNYDGKTKVVHNKKNWQ
ncbi:hypothetical protein Ptr902_06380 [Pyrenophora tritici-repentis]|uniref:Uncharacterized protein n=1 Tax=Pyrenophora tritici-repentis TaxID=45151 RepID=A0A5M9LGE7_9PLEO|nr:hypothetical protein PtrV1_00514 [Pyrenophora tritici-repentis]KAF7453231.1 hypothetical protein A1F99_004890 [Pyrenophora tritici-repentis]KAF7576292.1 hypothetical protein PtrM4_005320 [Pyrenophora tritici-repentis]KAI0577487.1 hypothetical protein Alg130_08337 [Pyrenophora tritici-repentis]KAI0577752.1 hypothetical protein Alg215_06735 [Pyrenophora tritici-repentis]